MFTYACWQTVLYTLRRTRSSEDKLFCAAKNGVLMPLYFRTLKRGFHRKADRVPFLIPCGCALLQDSHFLCRIQPLQWHRREDGGYKKYLSLLANTFGIV